MKVHKFHGIRAFAVKSIYLYHSMTDKGKSRFVIEPHSPYYHPSEGPGMMITAVTFDKKNYDLWERAVRTALRSKNKLGFIDGTLTRPKAKGGEDFSETDAWDMTNSMLCSWLLNVIDPKLRASIVYADTVKVMWDNKEALRYAQYSKNPLIKGEYSKL